MFGFLAYNKCGADPYLHWQLAEVRNGFINELTFIICIMYQIILYIIYPVGTVDHLAPTTGRLRGWR